MEVSLALVRRKRRKNHRDRPTVQTRRLINSSHRLEILDDTVENHETEILVRVLTTAELQHEPNLVAPFEESLRTTQLDVVIVISSSDAEFHFLHPCRGFGLALLELRLGVFIFPVVDDLANRRIRLSRDLDKVEPDGLGFFESLAG